MNAIAHAAPIESDRIHSQRGVVGGRERGRSTAAPYPEMGAGAGLAPDARAHA